jgi:heterodisulfide reductase subunit B
MDAGCSEARELGEVHGGWRRAAIAVGGLLAVMLTGCSASPEDLAKGARLVALETEQTKIMSTATSCGQLNKDLDAWYSKHKAEVDELDGWMKEKSEREQFKVTEGQSDQKHANANARIAAMVQCSGLPWNGKRR